MFKKKCFCGKSEKNFKFDIGPSFFNVCCQEAGYDKLGHKKDGSSETVEVSDQIEVEDSAEAVEELSQAVEMTNEEAQESKELPDLKKMKYEALKLLCKERGIEVTKDDRSKQSLIDKLEA